MEAKELKALLKVMRDNGVLHLKTDKVELQLAPEALFPNKNTKGETGGKNLSDDLSEGPYANFPDGELTPEQLMYYSSGGSPENDPYREDN